ncbi:hypothetical protein CDEST_00134 [Colletotrichum destructivum]|uniref:Uncharacterized protein n=1 Tax=Colletotrichum destructivum TaxID=34406 RepID=A0AAX4HW89_9PEZI|nr:hypothetical protein CDEST_00134 [Colletotrichum destructivum]
MSIIPPYRLNEKSRAVSDVYDSIDVIIDETMERDREFEFEAKRSFIGVEGLSDVEDLMAYPLREDKQPLSNETVPEKFLGLATMVYDERRTEIILDAVRRFPDGSVYK